MTIKKNHVSALVCVVILLLISIGGNVALIVDRVAAMRAVEDEPKAAPEPERDANSELFALMGESLFRSRAIAIFHPETSVVLAKIWRLAPRFGLDPELVAALVAVESGGNPRAVSAADCVGLMQVNFAVWREALALDRARLFEMEYNLRAGLAIFRQYYDETGSIDEALHRYNMGYSGRNPDYVSDVRACEMVVR